MTRMLPHLLAALSVFVAGDRLSHADAEEKRLGVAGVGFLASTSEGDARGDAFAWGGTKTERDRISPEKWGERGVAVG